MEDEDFSLYHLIDYIKDNIIGLLLLILSIFIVYIIDYITQINSLTFTMSPISNIQPQNKIFLKKNKKFKK
jgi:hypothetical protein